jgi:hypothetical protein
MRNQISLFLIILVFAGCKKDSTSKPIVYYKVKYEITSSDPTSVIMVSFTKPDGKDSTANPGLIPPLVDVPWTYQNSFYVDNISDPPKGKVGFTVLDNQAGLLTERIYVNDQVVSEVKATSTDNLVGVRIGYDLK